MLCKVTAEILERADLHVALLGTILPTYALQFIRPPTHLWIALATCKALKMMLLCSGCCASSSMQAMIQYGVCRPEMQQHDVTFQGIMTQHCKSA